MADALAAPAPQGIDRLRASFRGEVILPADGAYDDARRVWNAVFDRRPAVVVRPTTVEDVATAIRFARERDLEIAVRGGGHSAAGHSTCEGGLVIDLSKFRGVTVDAERRTARANGGALLGELDAAAQAHGLVCPVGVVGHTGVAGLTLGGGMGRLQRNFGLTIDNLRAVELVTADGRTVRASATEEPDLFWGIRGAGPNFGVVTAFEFDLHPFGGQLHRGMQIYPASQIHEAWGLFRDFAATAPDAVGLIFVIGRAEPASEYPESVAGQPIAIISFNHSGDPSAVERDLAPLRTGPEPVASTSAPHVYLEIQAANDEAMGFGHRSYIKGGYADDVRAETIDALVEHAARAPGEGSFAVTALGGAIGRVADDATAFTGRDARFEVSADIGWEDPAQDEVFLEWTRRAMAIIEPDAVVGRYVNEIAENGPEETRAIYGDAKLPRLTELKRAWDPDNVFHLNHNIAP
ncbi:MAG TPA: FAD-binding oxidoreductase [Candidatus Limnocylindrales bacterium]|nr:FAD-binding oxidoreductase [Candidatus Limnocylindrales bacterium]